MPHVSIQRGDKVLAGKRGGLTGEACHDRRNDDNRGSGGHCDAELRELEVERTRGSEDRTPYAAEGRQVFLNISGPSRLSAYPLMREAACRISLQSHVILPKTPDGG